MEVVEMATKEKKPMRTLEEVLESLKAAEKEYAQKCEEYGEMTRYIKMCLAMASAIARHISLP